MSKITILNNEIQRLKDEIKAKNEEISTLRQNSKCVRYADLEIEYKRTSDELHLYKQQFNELSVAFSE